MDSGGNRSGLGERQGAAGTHTAGWFDVMSDKCHH